MRELTLLLAVDVRTKFIACWFLVAALAWIGSQTPASAEPWQEVLSRMPLRSGITTLHRTNCVEVILGAFQSNGVVKALIFMPGATDELYMFRRARAEMSQANASLNDAVTALTNQTLIRATFRAPFLLLHSDEDPLEPLATVTHAGTAEKLKARPFLAHASYNDRDWDTLQPQLRKQAKVEVRPYRYSYDSWHFYRHSFTAWNLTAYEALEAAGLAGKSRFTVARGRVLFECDRRVRTTPKLDHFPQD